MFLRDKYSPQKQQREQLTFRRRKEKIKSIVYALPYGNAGAHLEVFSLTDFCSYFCDLSSIAFYAGPPPPASLFYNAPAHILNHNAPDILLHLLPHPYLTIAPNEAGGGFQAIKLNKERSPSFARDSKARPREEMKNKAACTPPQYFSFFFCLETCSSLCAPKKVHLGARYAKAEPPRSLG